MDCASNMVINKSIFNFVNIHDDDIDEEVFKGKKIFHRKPQKIVLYLSHRRINYKKTTFMCVRIRP